MVVIKGDTRSLDYSSGGLWCRQNFFVSLRVYYIRGLKRWDEGRWVKGSLVSTLLYWAHFLCPPPSSHLLSPLIIRASW